MSLRDKSITVATDLNSMEDGPDVVGIRLKCGHLFHDSCIVSWLESHRTCPCCRTPIRRNVLVPKPEDLNAHNSPEGLKRKIDYIKRRQGRGTPNESTSSSPRNCPEETTQIRPPETPVSDSPSAANCPYRKTFHRPNSNHGKGGLEEEMTTEELSRALYRQLRWADTANIRVVKSS
jgi:Ring finger domain